MTLVRSRFQPTAADKKLVPSCPSARTAQPQVPKIEAEDATPLLAPLSPISVIPTKSRCRRINHQRSSSRRQHRELHATTISLSRQITTCSHTILHPVLRRKTVHNVRAKSPQLVRPGSNPPAPMSLDSRDTPANHEQQSTSHLTSIHDKSSAFAVPKMQALKSRRSDSWLPTRCSA